MDQEIALEVISLKDVPLDSDAEPQDETPLVLVVDDEPLVADTLAAVLASSGLNVTKAYDGSSALEIATRLVPDLLLSDVMMPGMNGIELAISIATQLPLCKVLLFSGHASVGHLAPAYARGFDFPLMTKPMHPIDLLKRVSDCLQWRPQPARLDRRAADSFGPRKLVATELAS